MGVGSSVPGGEDRQRATTRILLGPFAVSLPESREVEPTQAANKQNSTQSTRPGSVLAAGAGGRRGELGQVCHIGHAGFHNRRRSREGDSRSLEVCCMYEQR